MKGSTVIDQPGQAPHGDSPTNAVPAGRSPRAIVLFVITVLVLLGSDLLFKRWSFGHVPPEGTSVIASVLSMDLTENRGAVFGIMQGQRWFFVLASVGAAAFIGWFFIHTRADEWAAHAALAFILGGAMGNLYDRVNLGAVRDMLHLFPGVQLPFGWRWTGGSTELYPWIFNLADVYLLVGIGVTLLRSFLARPCPPDIKS